MRLVLAYNLSRGRVLNDPRVLICKEVLRIPVSADVIRNATLTSKDIDLVRRATTMNQLFFGGVPFRGKNIRITSTSFFTQFMGRPKKNWVDKVHAMLGAVYPDWRDLFRETGRRLPIEQRKEFESRTYWRRQRTAYTAAWLRQLGAPVRPELVEQIATRIDAAIEFLIFVVRMVVLRNYAIEKHQSDVFDQLPVFYLTIDRFVVVSDDPDLLTRTQKSSQAARIKPFDQFLRTL
jgi:hypothetical protein